MFPFPFALFSKAGTLSQIYKFRVGHERVFFGSFLTLSEGLVGVLSWSWRRKRFNTETRRHRVLNISVSLSLCASRLSRGALRLLRSSLRSPNLIASRQAHLARLARFPMGREPACAAATPRIGCFPQGHEARENRDIIAKIDAYLRATPSL